MPRPRWIFASSICSMGIRPVDFHTSIIPGVLMFRDLHQHTGLLVAQVGEVSAGDLGLSVGNVHLLGAEFREDDRLVVAAQRGGILDRCARAA